MTLKNSRKRTNPSFRRKPESSILIDFANYNFLDTGFRRCDDRFFSTLLAQSYDIHRDA
jgi:hypothetical protein